MARRTMDKDAANDIDLLQDLVRRAVKAGADAADAVLVEGISLSHARRLGKTEKLERSEGQDLGLRVLVGKQQALVSSSDRSPKMLAGPGAGRPFRRLCRPRRDHPRLAAARHARPRRAERRNADRAGARRRGD